MRIKRTKEEQHRRAVLAAEENGGRCCSTEYNTRMEWECGKGHKWECSFTHVVNDGRWCRKCYSKSRSLLNGLDEAQAYAIRKGGLCLSTEFNSTKTKLHWRCGNNHEWHSIYDAIVRKENWCKECTIDGLRLSDGLERAKMHALVKNGICLSTSYVKCDDKLSWQCAKGHTWDASYSKVVRAGRWCATCSRTNNRSEKRVRMILETYFGFSLPSVRPDWNRNPLTNSTLELDGYNERFKLAFEHDGEHHQGVSKSRQYGHQREIQYRVQVYKDFIKKRNCVQRGITLINIPIVAERLREDFFIVLRHVISCCSPHEAILTFSLSQMRQMRQKFYSF